MASTNIWGEDWGELGGRYRCHNQVYSHKHCMFCISSPHLLQPVQKSLEHRCHNQGYRHQQCRFSVSSPCPSCPLSSLSSPHLLQLDVHIFLGLDTTVSIHICIFQGIQQLHD